MQDIPFSIYSTSFAIGLGIGLVIAIYFLISGNIQKRNLNKEIKRQKKMLQERLEVELESTSAMKDKIKNLEKENNNFKQSLQSLSQKASRAEIQQLAIYQKGIDILTAQSPGFGPAWQNALEKSKDEVGLSAKGVKPFIRNIVKGVLPELID
jgi:uncharacterized membrane protein YgaE (UPF0421/DUF939 family)